MKKIKISAILFILFISFSANAQDKLKEKATEQAKEFNLKLGNESLTSEQETMLVSLFMEKQKEIRTVKKDVTNEDEQKAKIKEIHKMYAKRISDKILNDKQKLALKENAKTMKNN